MPLAEDSGSEDLRPIITGEEHEQLVSLLTTMFSSADELRHFLACGPLGHEILVHLPEHLSLQELAFRAIRFLETRGYLDVAFFERLARARRPYAKQVLRIAQHVYPAVLADTNLDVACGSSDASLRRPLLFALGPWLSLGLVLGFSLGLAKMPGTARGHEPVSETMEMCEPTISEGSNAESPPAPPPAPLLVLDREESTAPEPPPDRVSRRVPLTADRFARALRKDPAAVQALRRCRERFEEWMGRPMLREDYSIVILVNHDGRASVTTNSSDKGWSCFKSAFSAAGQRAPGNWNRNSPRVELQLVTLLNELVA